MVALLLECERDPVPDVVAGVLPVYHHLMHRAARPWSAKIGDNTAVVQEDRDFPLRSTLDKGAIHPPDRLRLLGRPGHTHHAIGLDALVLASCELGLGCPGLINQATAQTIPGWRSEGQRGGKEGS